MGYRNEGRISVNMSADTKERLDREAERRGISRNALVVELIESLPAPTAKC